MLIPKPITDRVWREERWGQCRHSEPQMGLERVKEVPGAQSTTKQNDEALRELERNCN